jgi:SAM-dependent methyltransferase
MNRTSHTSTVATTQPGVPDAETCPICFGGSLKTLHRFSAEQAAEHFVPLRRDGTRHRRLIDSIEELWRGSACHIAQCELCKFAFPIPYVAGNPEFYRLAYGVPSYPRYRWEYGRAIEYMEPVSSSGSPRILELGAGVGEFIRALLRIPAFSPDRIVATDYSSDSVDALRKLGVSARLCSVFDLAGFPENWASFDAICAFQSIEHMADVVDIVVSLKKMLKPGGLLILSVPYGPAIEFSERYLGSMDMPPNHVGRWYRDSFELLAHRTGLALTAHEVEPARPLSILADAMQLRIHGAATANPHSWAARAQAIGNRGVRRVFSAAVGIVMLLPLLPALWRLNSGYSQLAVLQSTHARIDE